MKNRTTFELLLDMKRLIEKHEKYKEIKKPIKLIMFRPYKVK